MGLGFKPRVRSGAGGVQTPAQPLTSNWNHPYGKYTRDTCAPPFGYQTTVPKELEFSQESLRWEQEEAEGWCQQEDRQFRQVVRPPCRRDWILHTDGSDGQDHQDSSALRTSFYPLKPEPHVRTLKMALGALALALDLFICS